MENWQQRTELLLGADGVASLADSHVLVVGVGGVGAYAAEALVRAGVGHITIIDGDNVSTTNINRQLPALHSTIGQSKVEVVKARLLDINPELKIEARQEFVTVDSVAELLSDGKFHYVVDAIDSVAPKVAIIAYCLQNKIRIISSMGAGGRLDPSQIQFADLWKTHSDGLAKAVRDRLKKMGIRSKLPVVWSSEAPRRESVVLTNEIANKRSSYGTVSYLPAIFGLMLAAHVIRQISKQ